MEEEGNSNYRPTPLNASIIKKHYQSNIEAHYHKQACLHSVTILLRTKHLLRTVASCYEAHIIRKTQSSTFKYFWKQSRVVWRSCFIKHFQDVISAEIDNFQGPAETPYCRKKINSGKRINWKMSTHTEIDKVQYENKTNSSFKVTANFTKSTSSSAITERSRCRVGQFWSKYKWKTILCSLHQTLSVPEN